MRERSTFLMVLSSIFSACTVVLLYIATLSPSGRAGLLAISSFFPFILGYIGTPRVGFMCWLTSGILSFLFVPSKSISLLYVFCFGLYPLFRFCLEEHTQKIPLLLLKLSYANGSFFLFLSLFRGLFFASLPEFLQRNLMLFLLGGNAIFLVYDLGLSRVFPVIKSKLNPFLG